MRKLRCTEVDNTPEITQSANTQAWNPPQVAASRLDYTARFLGHHWLCNQADEMLSSSKEEEKVDEERERKKINEQIMLFSNATLWPISQIAGPSPEPHYLFLLRFIQHTSRELQNSQHNSYQFMAFIYLVKVACISSLPSDTCHPMSSWIHNIGCLNY